jgi:queuine tRNA-ribosyltransferase
MSRAFTIASVDGGARRARIETAHGAVETPAFIPVGTLGAVKGVDPMRLDELGATILLANFYHLALRPGVEAIVRLGGLHDFNGWSGPILTDSGGYQVFSLSRLREIDDHGVSFHSHLNGEAIRLTPERVVADQVRLGVDIAMMLDECPPWPASEESVVQSVRRTTAWARKGREAACSDRTLFFGIVQGGSFPHLRSRAVEELLPLDFDGYAIGGVSVGEPFAERREAVEQTAPLLPFEKPRYLMGLGTPLDILHGVGCGVDLFDCVLPSRNARHGFLFTRRGPLRIKNATFKGDDRPVEESCECPCCSSVSRAFLHHLFRCGEITAKVLATLHNLRFYLDFAAHLREAIASNGLADFAASFAAEYGELEPLSRSPASGETSSQKQAPS